MTTTIKVEEETKDRLLSLDLSEKGKTFDMLINDLITHYQMVNKKYMKDYKVWEKSWKTYQEEVKGYQKRKKKYQKDMKEQDKIKITWKKLLKWAKSKGFKE